MQFLYPILQVMQFPNFGYLDIVLFLWGKLDPTPLIISALLIYSTLEPISVKKMQKKMELIAIALVVVICVGCLQKENLSLS